MGPLLAMVLAQSCSSPYVCTSGNQEIYGQKVFYDLIQNYAAYSTPDGTVSAIDLYGHLFGGALMPVYDGTSLILMGSRHGSDPAAGVIITDDDYQDGGGPLSVVTGGCHAQILGVTHQGNLVILPAPGPGCVAAADVLHRGMLVAGNPASGAVAVQSAPGGYLVMEYRLAEQCALLPDGGRPTPDGGNEVQCFDDGGCCFAFSGKHGGLTSASSVPQKQGWAFETLNSGVYGGDDKFVVHATGAFGMANGLNRSEFPVCPSPLVMTSLGQFYPGATPGMFAYAADEAKYYACKPTGWEFMF